MKLTLNWKLTLFTLFFFGVFLTLGFWQIDRGYAKEVTIKTDNQRRSGPGKRLGNLPSETSLLDGQPIELQGRFLPELVFLLDNVVYQGKVGYEVLNVFEDIVGEVVILNRGFIPMGRLREDLPTLETMPLGAQTIKGNIYVKKGARLRSQNISNDSSPYVIQSAEPDRLDEKITKLTKSQIFPHVIRLSVEHPLALPRYWPIVTMGPDKHFGYALTWFSMAVAVVIAFLVFTVKTNRKN